MYLSCSPFYSSDGETWESVAGMRPRREAEATHVVPSSPPANPSLYWLACFISSLPSEGVALQKKVFCPRRFGKAAIGSPSLHSIPLLSTRGRQEGR